ncbi:MAG TPA: hypothetical protein V6D22_02880 [Candidatus Obscuribacterales bacterium]
MLRFRYSVAIWCPKSNRCSAAVLSLFACLALLSCTTASDPVRIIAHPPESNVLHAKNIQIDSKHPAQGLTVWYYHCRPQIKFDSRIDKVHHEVNATVRGVTLEVGLTIKQMLPQAASADVVAHEDGHAEICRRVYRDAGAIADECSRRLLGKQFSGGGTTDQQAMAAATAAAQQALCQDYASQTSARADALSAEYDRMTLHGAAKIVAAKAVEQVFNDEPKHVAPSQKVQ